MSQISLSIHQTHLGVLSIDSKNGLSSHHFLPKYIDTNRQVYIERICPGFEAVAQK